MWGRRRRRIRYLGRSFLTAVLEFGLKAACYTGYFGDQPVPSKVEGGMLALPLTGFYLYALLALSYSSSVTEMLERNFSQTATRRLSIKVTPAKIVASGVAISHCIKLSPVSLRRMC